MIVRRGGAERDRTADLVNAIHALSQLSYGPIVPVGKPAGWAAGASTYSVAGNCARAARAPARRINVRSGRLVLFVDGSADDVGHVGAVLLLLLEEGLLVALDDHQVLTLALGCFGLGRGRYEGRLLGRLAGGLLLGLRGSHGAGGH